MPFTTGEDYHTAAQRGLQEELGITAALPAQPLTTSHLRRLVIPGQYLDCEFVQSYQLTGWSGQVCMGALLQLGRGFALWGGISSQEGWCCAEDKGRRGLPQLGSGRALASAPSALAVQHLQGKAAK
jgi:hypothetical protein